MQCLVHSLGCCRPRKSTCVVLMAWALLPVLVMATPPPGGVAPVLAPFGGMEIDGNLFAGPSVAGSGDWIGVTNPSVGGQGILAPDGTPLNPLTTFHFVDPYNNRTADLIFSGGSKWADDPNSWGWTTGKPSSKADINNLLFHVASDAMGHTWLVMSADRASTQGESYIDFELLQNPLVRTTNGAFVSSGPHGGRTTNDLVLSLGFTSGGKVADFLVWRWEADGAGGYRYADITAALPSGRIFVALNTNVTSASYPVFGGTEYEANAFAEAAIDLTAMIDGVEACESFGFVAIMVKTKVSTSDSAGIEDFLDPIAYDFRIGPLADAGPDQMRCAEGGNTQFALGGDASAGLAPLVSTRWSVLSGTVALADSNSLTTTAWVSSPSATLRLDVAQLNGCTASDEVVLTAMPPPTVTVTGPGSVCPGATADFSAPADMDSYQWAISGNGALLGATNRVTATVRAGEACGEPLVLTLVVSTNICTVTAQAEVAVEDQTPPVLLTGPDRTVECGSVWNFDPVSAFDDCSGTNVLLGVVNTVTNMRIGETFRATRTWQATDPCGNTTVATQAVTVVDTTPPDIVCPPDIVQNTDPGACEAVIDPGLAIATDLCAGVTVVGARSDMLALTDPYPKGVTWITWTATDAVGLTNACLQSVTVIDNEPPSLSCPSELVVAEFPQDSGSALVDYAVPVAADNCGPAPEVVCTPPPGSTFPVGDTLVHCVATDSSGNTNRCSFTVRVIPYRVTVIEVTDSGPGGLRDALINANALPGENRIEFNIPGPGPHIIRPETNLPIITSPVILDGRSQPGFAGTPLIQLDGRLSGGAFDGLVFQSGSNTLQALAIVGFNNAVAFGTNAGGNTVQGTFLGVDFTGTNAGGNAGDGLRIGSANNRVGGSGPGEANLISGNQGNGILIHSKQAVGNQILGNFIGVGLDGSTVLPNGGEGIRLEDGAGDNRIGSVSPADANRILYNGRAGIALSPDAGAGNRIGINVLAANGGLGIDLGTDGVTTNDSGDSDEGPNHLQNFPVLTDARSVDGITTVDGSLTSEANRSYRLDFYLNETEDPTGHGEGGAYLGFATVVLGESGTAGFTVSFPTPAVFTQFVTATATDPDGNTSEFSQARQVRTPPVSQQEPSSTNAVAGSTVTLCAEATGTPPIFYQWRLNGANIPGETNQCITLTAVEAQSAGSYTVVVFNDLGGFGTASASLRVPITNSVPGRDDFADRQPLEGISGETQGANRGATLEAGEPLHAGKPGGHSVWYSWKAPEKGIVTLGTRGSSFDTLLGVYTGDHLTNLTAVASDEDRGGFFTSGLRFNVIKGVDYAIAIDGYFGESGDFVFGWTFEDTPHLLPAFLQQPQSLTVRSNGTAEFTALVSLVCGNGVTNCPAASHYPNGLVPGLETQWYHEGFLIPDATNSTLTVSNVQRADLGGYWVRATVRYYSDGVDRTIQSEVADLQINQTGQDGFESVQAKDKFLDTLLNPPWRIGGLVPPPAPASGKVMAASGLTSGYTGTQVFNTVGSTTSSGETFLCQVPGGASEWLTLEPQVDGMLAVDTIGSSYDTIMAIYTLTPSNTVVELDCNNDVPPASYSQLEVPVQSGSLYTILVDGAYGASGTLVLNYSLIAPATLVAGGPNGAGAFLLQVVGYPGMNFTIECSTNLADWTPLLSTNSVDEVFNYSDPTSPLSPGKYYRAVFSP